MISARSGRIMCAKSCRTKSENCRRSIRKSSKAYARTSWFPPTSAEFDHDLTFGERLSDRIAEFGGSWRFLITFGAILFVWIVLNAAFLATRAFDPFPFILLNLILSCLAAVQAPIIMMSQNRAEARDRLRAENDYKINLKAELEIRHLHEKIDHLLRRQYNRLFEIQQIQIELLEELGRKRAPNPVSTG